MGRELRKANVGLAFVNEWAKPTNTEGIKEKGGVGEEMVNGCGEERGGSGGGRRGSWKSSEGFKQ
jgi:hypothetical protein